MNSAVMSIYGLLPRRTIIMILVKDHKTISQADARKQRQQGSHYEGDLWLPSPSCCPSLARVRANTHAQPAWNVLFLGTQTAGSRLQPWRDDKHLFYPGLYFSHGL